MDGPLSVVRGCISASRRYTLWSMQESSPKRHPKSRRGRTSLLAGVAAIGLALLIFGRTDLFQRVSAPPASGGTPEPAVVRLTEDERRFYAFVDPRLRSIAAESDVLAELGNSKSRNILAIQTRATRVDELAKEIDEFIVSLPAPARFADGMGVYRQGVTTLHGAMTDAKVAFLRFDWTALKTAVDRFSLGAATMHRATAGLELAAGFATPPAAVAGTPRSASDSSRLGFEPSLGMSNV